MIRPVKATDSFQIAEIYNHYVLNSVSTFELEPIDEAEMGIRINKISAKYPYIVFEENGQVMGYAYASEWKSRKAYANTVESSVYLHPDDCNKGIGFKLYSKLLNELKKQNIHAIIGGISFLTPPVLACMRNWVLKK